MKLLVIYGSRYHATEDIAQAIGIALIDRGVNVDIRSVQDAGDINDYDAVIIGSAVYVGRWVRPVSDFVKRHKKLLAERPVWLFTSGPIGEPAMPREEPPETAQLAQVVQARGTISFAGRLEKERLSWGEQLMVTALRAQEGDFRKWPAIHDWADSIADALDVPAKVTN
jgi:menaquinone-dependent protoporphyrinogen oxidase